MCLTSIFWFQFGFAGVLLLSPSIFGCVTSRYIDIDLSSSRLLGRVRLRVVRLGKTRLKGSVDYLLISHRNLLERDLDAFRLLAVVAGDTPARYHGVIEKQLQINPFCPASQPTPLRVEGDGTGDELAAGASLEQRRAIVFDGK